MLKLTCHMIGKRNIIIKFGDILFKHTSFIRLIKYVSNTIEIKAQIHPDTENFLDAIEKQFALAGYGKQEQKRKQKTNGVFDYYMTNISPEHLLRYIGNDIPSEQLLQLGYVRRLPQWEKFLLSIVEKAGPNNTPYCLYILSTLNKVWPEMDAPPLAELLKETVKEIREVAPSLHIALKPHAITDMEMLHNILKEIDLDNFSINYSHPMALSANARFVIGNRFSCTMFDAYFQEKPIIEYTYYNRPLHNALNGKSLGGGCCDFFIDRNQKELKQAVKGILDGSLKVRRDRDFIEKNFPKTSDEFFQKFEAIISPERRSA